jgi:RNA polymerase sigma-70 factor (ECF subfamily)
VVDADASLDDAVVQTIEGLYPRLFRYARFRLEKADAEDATSAALERMWRERRRYRTERGPLEPWLATIGMNAIRDEVRRRFRRRATVEVGDVVVADPRAGVELVTRMIDVRRALAQLSPSDAELIGLRYALDLTNEEIAVALGQTRGAVATAMHRALARLREELAR